jgi:Tfp pilus assembly protein PilO
MNADALKDLLKKIPITPLFFLVACWHGYSYWQLFHSEESPILIEQRNLSDTQAENEKLNQKIKEAKEFFRTLEDKKAELRKLSFELDGFKNSLSESLDVPAFMKMVVSEAKRVGLSVTSVKPAKEAEKKEYYAEQTFDLGFRGVFAQLLVFLDRLSQAQKIVRVDSFDVRPTNTATDKYVEIEGSVQIKAYYYLGSAADELAKQGGRDLGSLKSKPVEEGGQ